MIRLGAGEAQVWFADPDALGGEAGLALLDAGERERAARFRFERDRRLAIAARALVRRALARAAGIAAGDWRFATTAEGRPEVLAPSLSPPLRFNAAHTPGLVMCAVTVARDIGVDAERIPARAPLEVAERHFAPVERAALLAAPAGEQAARFAELWTLKEAYVKARGLGLALALDGFGFALAPGAPPRLTASDDDGAAWQVERFAPTAEHRAALCLRRGGDPPLRVTVAWDG